MTVAWRNSSMPSLSTYCVSGNVLTAFHNLFHFCPTATKPSTLAPLPQMGNLRLRGLKYLAQVTHRVRVGGNWGFNSGRF